MGSLHDRGTEQVLSFLQGLWFLRTILYKPFEIERAGFEIGQKDRLKVFYLFLNNSGSFSSCEKVLKVALQLK